MEEQKDDFLARAYQVDLYEKALDSNTIIFLPTGSGKTFIAVMLIKKLSGAVLKPYSQGGKRTVFVVNTVPLVVQQSDYIFRHTGLASKGYSGDMGVDYWLEEKWMAELESVQVLCMTAQILVDILNHGYMTLKRINLIIFDECHRAVSDHPMRQIMQCFEYCPKEEQPRVLALTASLLNSNMKVEKVLDMIESLEVTFHAKVAAVESTAVVKGYSTNAKESIVHYDSIDIMNPSRITENTLSQKVDQILTDMRNILKVVHLMSDSDHNASSEIFKAKSKNKKLIAIVEDIFEHICDTGIYGGHTAVLLHMIQLEHLKKYCDNQQTVLVLAYLVTQLTKLRKLFDDEMQGYTQLQRIYKFSSDHILQLFAAMKNFYDTKSDDQKFCCIIFVKRRFTAKILYHILKNLHNENEQFEFLLAEFIVGFSNDPYKNSREVLCMSKWNKEVLLKFKNGRINCVVATDVVDEGLDVPACTLVIRYDLPMDFRSYIQSKGRARHSTSWYIIMLCRDDESFCKRYANFKHVEDWLQKILVGKTDSRENPSLDQIKKELYTYELKPYTVTNSDGAISVITELSAISIINKYCSNLYKSKFISLTPTWILHEVDDLKYKVSLQLPMTSPLKETIFGDIMPSIVSAKRSAALKCCIALHKINELTDNLIPRDVDSIVENVDNLFPNWIDEEKVENAMPGTYSKKRQHKLVYPESLYAAFPKAEHILYLHVIDARPTYSMPLDNRRLVFYHLLTDRAGFAILSTKKLPEVPSFPIFMNVGELHVDIKVNSTTLSLTDVEIESLRIFHSMIFNQVIMIIKDFMVFDVRNLDNSFLIVPINDKWQINWEIVSKYQCITSIKPSIPHHVSNNDYDLALVTPSYRTLLSVYIVTQICDELTADSSFPTDDFYSYVHYFQERHGLQIRDGKQPMLEVKPISTKINCIKPRSMKPGLSKRKRADLLEDFEEHLVPELCHRVDFPALYWLKATILPSVLHRISQLLVAEDLRVTIFKEAQFGVSELLLKQKWKPLIVTEKESEDTGEPLLELTLDETMPESSQPQPELSGPEIDVLGLESKLYPWTKEQEPSDIIRDAEQIQLIDIEYYFQFISSSSDNDDNILSNRMKKHEFMTKPKVSVPPLKALVNNDQEGPSPVDIMQALTSKLGNDVFNLERLETLGDSLLKFVVSLYLFESFPTCREGQLTELKGKIVGNRNLYYCGTTKNIPGRMKVDDFVPYSNFIAPAYTAHRDLQKLLLEVEVSPNILYDLKIPPEERLSGHVSQATMYAIKEKLLAWEDAEKQSGMEHFIGVQTVPDKVVSDCVEALIGVYLNSMGLKDAVKLLIWFGILPNDILIDKLLFGKSKDPQLGQGDPNFHMPLAASIEKNLGYTFKNRAYLLQAFTHPSYTPNTITVSYERLEFLGDAIIDFLITIHIYESGGNLSPGALTDLRSALVNNITFACLAVRYGLHTAILAYAPKINEIIDRFVKFQEERNHVVDDELLWVLLEEEECNMAEYVDVPKVLGDVFESVIGAIYLDSGKDISKVWEILYALMHKEIDAFSKNVPKQPVRVIYETQGARPKFSKSMMIENTNTTAISLEVVVSGKTKLFHGFGANKKQAKCAAAKQALKCLRCKK